MVDRKVGPDLRVRAEYQGVQHGGLAPLSDMHDILTGRQQVQAVVAGRVGAGAAGPQAVAVRGQGQVGQRPAVGRGR